MKPFPHYTLKPESSENFVRFLSTHSFAGLKYTNSYNVGDYIQSIAAEQFLPRISQRFDRDTLGSVPDVRKQYIFIANGWFSHTPELCFPFPSYITPLFYGFHITNWNNSWQHFCQPTSLEYFKKFSPVGCRDRFTAEILQQHGIETYYSKCLTLTFPKRKRAPKRTKYIIVDASHIKLPEDIADHSEYFTHHYPDKYPEREKFDMARQLLDFYCQKATAVITTRLHCALPCLAMGIPVVFFGNPSDYRISILTDIGIKIHSPLDICIDWDESIRNIDFDTIENIKTSMVADIKQRIINIIN
jgi:hypothetical protein